MRIKTTLCGLLLSLGLAAQSPCQDVPLLPVTENYRDFSDWHAIDSLTAARFHDISKYPVPQHQSYRDEVASAQIYLDAVKVPDWDAYLGTDRSARSSVDSLRFSGDSTLHLPNLFHDDAAYFYFPNGSYELSARDSADVRTLVDYHVLLRERGERFSLSPYDTSLRFTVEGRADRSPFAGEDSAASMSRNDELSARRATAIGALIGSLCPEAEVEVRSFGNRKPLNQGETRTPEGLARERVALVIPGKTSIERALEEVEADYTIGDGSYSMVKDNGASYPPLEIVMLYPYENGNVFLFSDRGAVRRGNRWVYNHVNEDDRPVLLPSYRPAEEARTPLREVLMYLSLVADPGTSFRFITDGEPSPSQVRYDHIISVAQRRHVSFSFIGTSEYNGHFEDLKRVARLTGGETYLACKPHKDVLLSETRGP